MRTGMLARLSSPVQVVVPPQPPMLAMAITMPTRVAVRIVAAVLLALWIACLFSREGRGEKHSTDYDNHTQHGSGWRGHRSVTYFFLATAPSPTGR
jgi:hypothetical protein